MSDGNTWVTKDGRHLLISEMDDNHLENTIQMLERKGIGAAVRSRPLSSKEDETLTEDQFIDRIEGVMAGAPTFMLRKFRQLDSERSKRKKENRWDPSRK